VLVRKGFAPADALGARREHGAGPCEPEVS
jgi:hypothetical protein